jgi:four helix bundle protein
MKQECGMAGRNYQDLIAWQKAMDLVVSVYELTRRFPVEERYGLSRQLRRAVVSIPSNIAEGQGRKSTPSLHISCQSRTGQSAK